MEVENWRARGVRLDDSPVLAVAVAVVAVMAAGVRRVGWKRDRVGLAMRSIPGRWMIVRRVRRVREEIRGGILVDWRSFLSRRLSLQRCRPGGCG